MKYLNLTRIKRDDEILLNFYRDYIVSIQGNRISQYDLTDKRAISMIDLILNQIEILELQISKGKGVKRFEYISERIMFWKNVLMYQFNYYTDTASFRPPGFF